MITLRMGKAKARALGHLRLGSVGLEEAVPGFCWVPVRSLAGTLEDVQTLVPDSLLRSGCASELLEENPFFSRPVKHSFFLF